MTNSQSVEQDGIVAGNIFAMLDNATIVVAMSGVSRQWYCSWSVKLNLTTVKPVSSFQQILLHVIDLLRHL